MYHRCSGWLMKIACWDNSIKAWKMRPKRATRVVPYLVVGKVTNCFFWLPLFPHAYPNAVRKRISTYRLPLLFIPDITYKRGSWSTSNSQIKYIIYARVTGISFCLFCSMNLCTFTFFWGVRSLWLKILDSRSTVSLDSLSVYNIFGLDIVCCAQLWVSGIRSSCVSPTFGGSNYFSPASC